MTTLDLPKLRPLQARRISHQGQDYVALEDPAGVVSGAVLVPLAGFLGIVRYLDGATSLEEIRTRVERETGQLLPESDLRGLVAELDRAMVLDGPTFAAFRERYRREEVREAAFAGRSYAGNEPALRSQIDNYFRDERGAGPLKALPAPERGSGARLRAVLCPHIDFFRGGPTYTWAYRELVERSDAEVFVVLGVAHQGSRHRFALTTKDFATPLGLVKTDRAYVERIAEEAGGHLFDDELAHRTEHSIEFQAVFLRHVLGDRRPFAIVPILVGSFHDLMEAGIDPIGDPEVARFVEALRRAEAASGRKVAYVGGIDLCHVGREFGDSGLLDRRTLEEVRRFDEALLDRAVAGDPAGWFAEAARVENRYRVCGLAATYTLLRAIGPTKGRLLRYDQAVNPERTCGVTFASVALDGESRAEGRGQRRNE
jgi:AmmeMemoRadiSam system protein B